MSFNKEENWSFFENKMCCLRKRDQEKCVRHEESIVCSAQSASSV